MHEVAVKGQLGGQLVHMVLAVEDEHLSWALALGR
jgi:hypothetical protein